MPARAVARDGNAKQKKGRSDEPARRSEPAARSSGPVDHVVHLQRSIGNRAVQRLIESSVIQARMKISQPDDIYEQEADRVAAQVMSMPEPANQAKPG